MDKEQKSFLDRADPPFEMPLRPSFLDEFIGQQELKERLKIAIGAAKQRQEPLVHTLFCGPPGLGKTTLAHILSKEMQSALITTSGPLLERPSDLAGLLTNLQPNDFLFIDEIHRLNKAVEEYLYPAMEDFKIDLVIDSGPHARSVELKLNRFTLIGATTRMGLLSAPMRSRFGANHRLNFYKVEELQAVLARSAKILGCSLTDEALCEIAKRCRGTPRIANHLLRWVRDFAMVRSEPLVRGQIAKEALAMLAIDEKGLDETDKKILEVIIDHYNGGPVGLNTLAVGIGELGETLEEVYEPFLILQGFLKRTARGRVATALAYAHLGKKLNGDSVI